MTVAPEIVTKLDELMTAIRGWEDPRRATGEWKHVYKLLQNTELPPGRVTAVVGMRNVAGLAELIEELVAPTVKPPEAAPPDAETCRRALRAFRKRQALTQLDEESTLGRGPLSKGASGTTAIVPPTEWPESVWNELVRQGCLRCIGDGLYERTKQ